MPFPELEARIDALEARIRREQVHALKRENDILRILVGLKQEREEVEDPSYTPEGSKNPPDAATLRFRTDDYLNGAIERDADIPRRADECLKGATSGWPIFDTEAEAAGREDDEADRLARVDVISSDMSVLLLLLDGDLLSRDEKRNLLADIGLRLEETL